MIRRKTSNECNKHVNAWNNKVQMWMNIKSTKDWDNLENTKEMIITAKIVDVALEWKE